MPQAYFLTDYTLTEEVTVTFDGDYPLVLTIPAGSWFSNPIAAWIWILLNHLPSGNFHIAFDDQYGSLFGGQIYVTEYPYATFITFAGDDTFADWLGVTSESRQVEPDPDSFMTEVVGDFYYPYWGLRSYEKGLQHMAAHGGQQRAFAGNAGSWGGTSRETITLSVNIDRQDNVELQQWADLWRKRWRNAGSVSMYFYEERNHGFSSPTAEVRSNRIDHDIYLGGVTDPEDETEVDYVNQAWVSLLTQCDQLLFVEEDGKVETFRVIDHKNAVSYVGPHKFQRNNVGGAALRGYSKLWRIE